MRPTEPQLRQQLTRYGQRLWQRGFVSNHDGNLSVRLPRDRVLCTPTGVSKADLAAEMAIVVDARSGKQISGALRPFSELGLHLAFYRAREDAQAVAHAHPPVATAFGVAGVELPHPFLPEAVVTLGGAVPTVPLAAPGEAAVEAIAPYLADHHALLLAGNGVITCGADVEQAYLRMELVEHLCRIAQAAQQLGGVRRLPAPMVEALVAAHVKAGLGPRQRGDQARGAAPDPDALRDLVKQEIARVLGR